MAAAPRPALSIRVASSMPAATARWSQPADWSGETTGMEGMAVGGRLFVALPDGPAEGDLAVVDAEIEPAVGIGADPGLISDRRTFAAVVGQRDQGPLGALLTRRPLGLFH